MKKARWLLSLLLVPALFTGCSSAITAPEECTAEMEAAGQCEFGWPTTGN